MSMIRCEHPCAYQKDGYCGLDKAVSVTNVPFPVKDCVYFTPARNKIAAARENKGDFKG